MANYFHYFNEIEAHFQRRRGTRLLLSTLDWALSETWKDAGIPLEAVLRGIDEAFDRYEQRPSKTKKVNSLAYCSQLVLAAAEDMKEAAVGAETGEPASAKKSQGFEPETVVSFLRRNADLLDRVKLPNANGISGQSAMLETVKTLSQLAEEIEKKPARLKDLERRLTVLEEKLFAVLMALTADDEIVAVRAQADRDLAPYRSKMSGAQIDQLQKQYVHKR